MFGEVVKKVWRKVFAWLLCFAIKRTSKQTELFSLFSIIFGQFSSTFLDLPKSFLSVFLVEPNVEPRDSCLLAQIIIIK